jgi:hypothetical protein
LNRSLPRTCAAVATALLALPGAAHAAQIDGDPLVIASDDTGRLGVAYKDAPRTEFCCGTVGADGVVPVADQSGFVVVGVSGNGVRRFGVRFGNTTLTSPPVVLGTGTSADPFRLSTTWQGTGVNGNPILEINQQLLYVNGDEEFRAVYSVRNLTSQQQFPFRAATGADLAGGGADVGRGLFEPGPPRVVGGYNFGVGAVDSLVERTTWSHFEEGQFSGVLSRAVDDPRQNSLHDVVEANPVDNGVAVQWDQNVGTPLPPGQSAGFEVTWRFRRTFALTPQRVDATTGDRVKFDVSLTDPGGIAQADTKIRWAQSGTNTASDDTATRSSGHASFEVIGANPGTDTVTAYADLNDNETHDQNEPQREATITWAGPDAPQFGEEVNLKPVSGRVLIRLPGNARVKGRWAHAAQAGFVPLSEVSQVPVGAELDTTGGRVQLTSSTSTSGEVQSAQFYSGRFQVRQSAREAGLTEVRLTQTLQCKKGSSGKLAAAASRSRRLWGNGKGRFRTRGRHSSATVRGTIWLQKDTCNTTTTTVRSGTVTVRDFGKRKNVKVKKGKKYVARAGRR